MYTPETATEKLKEIAPILRELKEKQNQYTRLIVKKRNKDQEEFEKENELLDALEYEIVDIIKKLEQEQIYVRKINPLIVDFLAIRLGQPVYLCWKEKEVRVMHYHGTAEGFSHRRIVTPFDEWQVFLIKN